MERPKEKKINFGVDFDKQFQDMQSESNYRFGAVTDKIVLKADGQWLNEQPECEMQQNSSGEDRMNCVSNSESNFKKIILKTKFNLDVNPSQRFRAKMAGTTRSGTSLYAVANSARKDGFVLDIDWPENPNLTWSQYYSSIPSRVIEKGKKSVLQFDVNYEQVPVNPASLMNSLQYGPVQAIGYAWAQGSDGLYHDYGYRPNHAFLIVGYVEDKYWLVYDSYPTDFILDSNSTKQEFTKKLAWDFHFGDAMLYSVKLKTTDKQSWLYKIFMALKNFYRDIKSGKFYFVKTVNGKTMKQEITSVNGVLTVLDVNFGSKGAEWGELAQYTNKTFFN